MALVALTSAGGGLPVLPVQYSSTALALRLPRRAPHLSYVHIEPRRARPLARDQFVRPSCWAAMALPPTSAGGEPEEVEMNAGADQAEGTVVRATVVQACSVFYNTPATLDKAERLIAEAAGYGSHLVVFPEAFIGGYPHGSTFGYGITISIANPKDKGKGEFQKYLAAAIDVPGPEVSRLAALAGKYKVFLVMGVVERAGCTLYNTVLSFDSLGKYLGKHRNLMPTGLERIIFGFGDGPPNPVYDTPLGKIGAAIGWENRMPLLRTALYAKGIQIYCAPTADGQSSCQTSMEHIADEGMCFVLVANQFCRATDYPAPPEYTLAGLDEEPSPETVVSPGGSSIISPSGTVLAGPNYEGEALLTADLDLGQIGRGKFDRDVVGHYARDDVFRLSTN